MFALKSNLIFSISCEMILGSFCSAGGDDPGMLAKNAFFLYKTATFFYKTGLLLACC